MQPIANLVDRLGTLVLFPVALFLGGLVIHLYSIFLLIAGRLPSSLWVWWVNIFMLVFDLVVLVGLIRMRKTAYLVAAAGFLILALTWAVNSVMEGAVNFSTAAGIAGCVLGLPILVCAYRKLRNG
ncbi:MAG: hypothetical protein JW748_01445 [Anaerolineales bacterium]|nr:hypothetical protein [Anaerolineales bacterium]